MIEIIPNWHPVFVHFTVALLLLAVILFLITPLLPGTLQEQWRIVARWSLWFGMGFTVITGLTGLYAYNTVAHDTPSHAAMTDHRNWAITTIVLFLVLTAWSIVCMRRNKPLGALFVAGMVIAGVVLATTAWRGGEVVYRFGLGVMSLPKAEGEGHAHGHADEGEPGMAGAAAEMVDKHPAGDVHQRHTETAHTDETAAPGSQAKGNAISHTNAEQQDHHDDDHTRDH